MISNDFQNFVPSSFLGQRNNYQRAVNEDQLHGLLLRAHESMKD